MSRTLKRQFLPSIDTWKFAMKTSYQNIQFNTLPPYVQHIIAEILDREGSVFTDHPNDWPTKYGIRQLSADRAGYRGSIKDLTAEVAACIWTSLFWFGPNLHMVGAISPLIAETVVDTSGPAGLKVGISHLQQALTSYNMKDNVSDTNIYGPDLQFDGLIGGKTLKQLEMFLKHRRNKNGAKILATRLNCMQDSHYTQLAIRKPGKRDFSFGWSRARVYEDLVALSLQTDNLFL